MFYNPRSACNTVTMLHDYVVQVFCRYSEFSALHDLLHAECPSFKGTMPPKRRFLAEDLKFLEARRVALARWMDVRVCALAFVRVCMWMRSFTGCLTVVL